MNQVAPRPSAKKISRTLSKVELAGNRCTSVNNKMPEAQASTGSAQNRGRSRRAESAVDRWLSQHREGQEEPNQQRNPAAVAPCHQGDCRVDWGQEFVAAPLAILDRRRGEYDGSRNDMRVIAGQVTSSRTNANTLPDRMPTASPDTRERLFEALNERSARMAAVREVLERLSPV